MCSRDCTPQQFQQFRTLYICLRHVGQLTVVCIFSTGALSTLHVSGNPTIRILNHVQGGDLSLIVGRTSNCAPDA